MKKKSQKKKQRMILVFFILLIFVFVGIYITSIKFQMQKKGYSTSEIALIEKNLEKEDIKQLLRTNKKIPITDFEQTKEFDVKKLNDYITFYQKVDGTAADIVFAVARGITKEPDLKPKNFDRYIAYQKKFPTLDSAQTVLLVNQNIDQIQTNNVDTLLALMKDPYFISENIERYLSYEKQNNNIRRTVRDVNANADYDFYTHTTPSNLDHGYLVLANKYTYLDANYVPSDLVAIEGNFKVRKDVRDAYQKMKTDAAKEGLSFHMNSAYRSYQSQQEVYNEYRAKGQIYADKYASRPGYSEHQTGLAIDITTRRVRFQTFDETEEYHWLQEHAHEYGFILRFPQGLQSVTGYNYEPWHYRYVGVENATKIKKNGITFEEYHAYFVNR